MNLRELMQTLVLVPMEKDVDVLFRNGDSVAKVEGVSLLVKAENSPWQCSPGKAQHQRGVEGKIIHAGIGN